MHSSFNASRRRSLLSLGALPIAGLLGTSALAATQAPPVPATNMLEMINQAGRQRMLSQRIAKLYAQQIRGIRDAEARNLLGESMRLFDTQLLTLREFVTARGTPALVDTYHQLSERWLDYKQVSGTPASLDGLKKIAVLNEQVLSLAHQGTVQLEALHGGSLGKLVNIAGRQRMLSQRMSKFYFFLANGIDLPDMRQGLDNARKDFLASMQTLKMAPENNKITESWIQLADMQWMFFNDALRADAKSRERTYLETNVAVTSENILQVMDKLTGLYATLS